MPTVRMKSIYAGPSGQCGPGKTIEVGGDEAKELVAGGFAELVKEDRPAGKAKGKKKAGPSETATGDGPSERA